LSNPSIKNEKYIKLNDIKISMTQGDVNEFIEAAARGNLEKVKEVYTRGVDVTAENNRALIETAKAGNFDIVMFLVKQGVGLPSDMEN
jgi:hypothetical protein